VRLSVAKAIRYQIVAWLGSAEFELVRKKKGRGFFRGFRVRHEALWKATEKSQSVQTMSLAVHKSKALLHGPIARSLATRHTKHLSICFIFEEVQ
jgi:hypothetical protein